MKNSVTVACCMPTQQYDLDSKMDWLSGVLDRTACDLFLTPQEYLGGHYIMPKELHIDRNWLVDNGGDLARKRGVHLGIGACIKSANQGPMEDYAYFDSNGHLLGWHSKFALPSYDDQRTGGHGQLWPETNYRRRTTVIDMPALRLKVGTVFCWEVFSQTIFSAYSFNRTNLIVHPIKFAPRGWLKNKKKSDGFKHIVGFGNAPKSQIWIDRLLMASRHQVMCPIAVSCNSWDLGAKFMALVGHIDELNGTTDLHDVPAVGDQQYVHTFEMLPELYEGLDHHHSAGAFVAHTGSIDGYHRLGEWTMHGKIRRIESHLIGGTAAMECVLKAASAGRQKASIPNRAFGARQKVKLRRKT